MPSVSSPLHAFDFDGTLTYKDSFLAFLAWQCGVLKLAAVPLLGADMGLSYLWTGDRGALKSRLMFHLLGPMPRADLEARFDAFAKARGQSLFRPDALRTWQSLSADRRVIVTASPTLLVSRFGDMIGADLTIGTELGFDAEGRLTPDLASPNCRGVEKMTRLKAVFGEDVVIESAYGDTSGDREMLAAARNGHYRLFREKP